MDIHASRLALAGELGATHQINGKEQDAVAVIKQITGKGAHYAVETTGVSAIVLQAVRGENRWERWRLWALPETSPLNVQNDLMAEGKSLVGVIEGDAVPALFIPLLVQLYKQGKFLSISLSPAIRWPISTRPSPIRRPAR
ncbi:zinc-binding dehydrogenase [Klebsiella pneumoniae]